MSSLLDIGPLTASVTVRGKDIVLNGIGSDTLVQLMHDHPDLHRYMSGALGGKVGEDQLMKLGPEISMAIILAGAGFKSHDEKARKIVASLTIGEQMMLLDPIMTMTFPKGFPSFVDAMSRFAGESAVAAEGGPVAEASAKALDTK